AKIFSKIP
ncbi:uncharacterized protein WCI35_018582, partial [Daubentonia madagascariensis]